MNGKNQKKKSGGGSALLVFLLIVLLPRLFEALESTDFRWIIRRIQYWAWQNGIDPEILPLIVIGIVVLAVVLISAAKVSAKKAEESVARTAGRTTNARAGRTSAATQRPDPRNRSFTPPEPSCIVCDHTGEDHFVRDKAQRIAQLEEWLKNGLIDREEYRVLKDRYERDL